MKNENDDNKFNAGLAYADYRQALVLYILAALAAFLMSSYFMVSYATGGIDFDKWGAMEWKYAITAVMVTAVMTGFQFRLYGNGDMKNGGKIGVLAVLVAVAFSLLSEVGQGMERDEVRMETKSQASPTYQAALAALGNSASASYNPYSADLQAAEVKLAQCQARLAQGKEKHCDGSAARVEAVNKMIATHNTASQQQATALLDKAKSMEKDESNYFPIVGVIVEWLGVSGKTASLLFSVIIIGMFEYAFHYLGGDFNKARQKLMQHGYDVTRRLRQPPRKFDGSISTYSSQPGESAPVSAFTSGANSAKQTVSEYAAKIEEGLKASPEVIATEYARAQYAREQTAAITGDALKVVGDKIESVIKKPDSIELDKPEIKPANMKQSPEQLENVKRLYQEQMKDYEAGKIFSESPTPAIKRQSVAETIGALLDAVKKSGAKTEADIQAAVFDGYSKLFNPADLDDGDLLKVAAKIAKSEAPATPSPAMPFQQRTGATGLHNPALGTAEEHYPLPLPTATPTTTPDYLKGGERTTPATTPTTTPATTPDYLKGSEGGQLSALYRLWITGVLDGTVKSSEGAFADFVNAHIDSKRAGLNKAKLAIIWDKFGQRGVAEGKLIINPEYTPGNRKTKYLKA